MGTHNSLLQGQVVRRLHLFLQVEGRCEFCFEFFLWRFDTHGHVICYQGDKPDMIPPIGFYVVTDDIFDDTKWSDATYFEEQGFDQDVSENIASVILLLVVNFILFCSSSLTMTIESISPLPDSNSPKRKLKGSESSPTPTRLTSVPVHHLLVPT